MRRPENCYLLRAGERVLLELAAAEDAGDGLQHWSSSVALEKGDELRLGDLYPGTAIHFRDGTTLRREPGGTVQLLGRRGEISLEEGNE